MGVWSWWWTRLGDRERSAAAGRGAKYEESEPPLVEKTLSVSDSGDDRPSEGSSGGDAGVGKVEEQELINPGSSPLS